MLAAGPITSSLHERDCPGYSTVCNGLEGSVPQTSNHSLAQHYRCFALLCALGCGLLDLRSLETATAATTAMVPQQRETSR